MGRYKLSAEPSRAGEWRRSASCLFAPPALGEGLHRSLATLGIAVCRRSVLVVPEGQRPHPGASYGRGVGLEDANDADARLRISKSRPDSIIAISVCLSLPLLRASLLAHWQEVSTCVRGLKAPQRSYSPLFAPNRRLGAPSGSSVLQKPILGTPHGECPTQSPHSPSQADWQVSRARGRERF
jgi:hypothetical protein